jgi:RHH-type proline utilization regulon transcriptional repressor/proline dehydrogenase/delta 1-pyrroline-5-carboxylate dehydrogenase
MRSSRASNISIESSFDGVALEADVQRIGRELAEAFPARARHPLKAVDDRAMELASRDMELRAALFRLVDVTPACRSLDDLARHLGEYIAQVDDRTPTLAAAMRAADSRAGRKALGAAAAAGVRHMAHRFIVGESPRAALKTLRALHEDGVLTTVDLLGEATVSSAEADRYAERCVDALDTLAEAMGSWPGEPQPNLSVKVSALTPALRPQAPALGRDDAAGRLRPLLARARDLDAHLHVDMESLDSLETTLELVFELLDEEGFQDGPSAGLVLQAYLRDSPEELDRILEWARTSDRRAPLVIRLVKGAYWDHEVIEARQHGWSAPVFETKAECDRNFEELTGRLLDARPVVRVAIASHNLRSVAHALAYAGDTDLEVQVLRGLGDDLAHALARRDVPVRAYCPVGDLVAGMAYLVRRLLENTANESFLHEQARGVAVQELLAAP